METLLKLSDAMNPKIEAAKAALIAGITNDADAKTLKGLQTELTNLQAVQNRMAKDEASTDDEDEVSERAQARLVVKAHIRALLAEDDYYYVHDMEKFILYRAVENKWIVITPRAMVNHHSQLSIGSDYWSTFMEVMKEDGRWFYGRTSSFKPSPGNLNMLRPQLIVPKPGTPHPIFKLTMRSVCGDKAENIEHFEKVLVAKHRNPSNYLLPAICLSDDGATGKSLFTSKVLSTMFGATSVFANAAMVDFAGQFNGHLAGKLVILINENCEDSYNHNRMKAIAASPTMTFTNKGQMPYEGDNTALLIVTGNSIAGSIRVDGGDVDRRFSLIRGTRKLSTYTAEWLAQDTGKPVTASEAEEWMAVTGQHILSDPDQVAIWLHSLIAEQGDVDHVAALHGADYLEAVSNQKPLYAQCFEAFFKRSNFNYVRRSVLYDFYRDKALAQGNRISMGKNKFYAMAEKWLSKNLPSVVRTAANWGDSTAEVYVDTFVSQGLSKPRLEPNDEEWFRMNGFGKEWRVTL